MSSICGYWNFHEPIIGDSQIQLMVDRLNHWKADYTDNWNDEEIGFGHLMLYNTPESLTEKLPFYNTDTKICITADARIDNREEISKKIGLDKNEITDKADSWFIVRAYEEWGEDCTKHLEGDFAFAIWDKLNQKIFCARDQIGIKPFYYYFKDGFFAFATEMKGILSLSNIDKTVNEKWIAKFIVNIRTERVSSLYQHIHRLEAAHQLVVTNSNIDIKKYWELDTTNKIHLPNESDYRKIFLEKLDHAVAKRLRSNWAVSSEMSGGIDSSVVTAIAHKELAKNGKSITSISDVLPNSKNYDLPPITDDRQQMMEVIQHIGIKDFHFVTGEEKTLIDSMDRAVNIHDEPPIKFINVFGDLLYEKTQALNSRVLLSGFGGNEIVSYRGNYFLEELLRGWKWKTFWKELHLKAQLTKTSPYKKLMSVIISAISPNYDYYKSKYIHRSDIHKIKFKAKRSGIQTSFFEKFFTEDQLIRTKLLRFEGKTINEKIASRLTHPYVFHHRLEYCNLSAAHNRVEYRYPLLDLPLIQFFTSIPTTEKIKNGWSRYFFRKISEGLIPEKVSWLSVSNGSSSPSYVWRMHRDKKLVLETLSNLPAESLVTKYIDKDAYIKTMTELMHQEEFNNYGGKRLYLLQKILDRISKSTDH
jgi:asparagine synthase (glutamine-hydrolysing)